MERSAANGKHMLNGLTSPSRSGPKGGDKGGEKKGKKEVRGAQKGGEWKQEGRNHQMLLIDVWYNTWAQYAGRVLAGFPDLYSPEVGETAD